MSDWPNLPGSSIAALQRLNDANLPHRATLEAADESIGAAGDGGAIVTTYRVIAYDVRCRCGLIAPGRERVAERDASAAVYAVAFSVDDGHLLAQLGPRARLTVTGRAAGATLDTFRRALEVLYEVPESAGAFRRMLHAREVAAPGSTATVG